MKYLLIAAVAYSLAACATVTDGTRQGITLTSNVDGAMCGIEQNGAQIVAPAPVPATHNIPRRGGNLIVTCSAEGYVTEKVALVTGKHPMAVTGVLDHKTEFDQVTERRAQRRTANAECIRERHELGTGPLKQLSDDRNVPAVVYELHQ